MEENEEYDNLKQAGEKVAREVGNQAKKQAQKATQAIKNKIKQALMKALISILPYILIAVVVIVLIAGFIYVLDEALFEDTSKVMAAVREGSETENSDYSSLVTIEGDNESGYSLKINEEEFVSRLEKSGLKPEDYGLKDFECLSKFLKAEIVTQYPDLRDEQSLKNDSPLSDGEVQGVVKIKRVTSDGTEAKYLTYVPEDEFNSYKDAESDSEKNKALEHFTLNSSGELVYASWRRTTTKVSCTDSSIELEPAIDEYCINYINIPYKSYIQKYVMPFEFPLALLIIGEDEEFAVDVADLALNSQIVITIEDNLNTTINKEEETVTNNFRYERIYNYSTQMGSSTIYGGIEKREDTAKTSYVKTIESIIETNTPNIEITEVNSWIVNISKTYQLEPTDTGDVVIDPIETVGEEKLISKEVISSDSEDILQEIVEKEKTKYSSSDVSCYFVNKYKNTYLREDSYITGSTRTQKNQYTSSPAITESNEEEFITLFKSDEYKDARGNIKSADEWLFEMLEENERTVELADIMRYLLYKSEGIDYGVTELDSNIFSLNDFVSISTTNNTYSMIKEYIHAWEGQPKQDGDQYIIFDDGAGYPTVGWGISINTSGFKQKFIDAGYPTNIGGKVDKDFVDALEDEAIQARIDQVNNLNLNLTSYQVAALVSRSFNYNISEFKENYQEYWQEENNEQYYGYTGQDIYSHQLYTNYMCSPTTSKGTVMPGLVKRRKSEWLLFMTGYCDKLNMMWPIVTDTTAITNGISYYDASGNVSPEAVEKINDYLTNELLNTTIHIKNSVNQSGPFAKWWANSALEAFQCTWWANNRADQYLEYYGTKRHEYPTEGGHGGQYYDVNLGLYPSKGTGGWFKYGQEPKANSIISWKKGNDYGHVAYVEAVDSTGIWISHAGGAESWFGIQKIPLDGSIWSGYKLNGYIYLDEPL